MAQKQKKASKMDRLIDQATDELRAAPSKEDKELEQELAEAKAALQQVKKQKTATQSTGSTQQPTPQSNNQTQPASFSPWGRTPGTTFGSVPIIKTANINPGEQIRKNQTPIEPSTELSDVIGAPQAQDLARQNKAAVREKLQQQKDAIADRGTQPPVPPPQPQAPEPSLLQRDTHAGAASKMPDANMERIMNRVYQEKKAAAEAQRQQQRQKPSTSRGLSPFKGAGIAGSPLGGDEKSPVTETIQKGRRIAMIVSLIGAFFSCMGCVLPLLVVAGGAYAIASSLGII